MRLRRTSALASLSTALLPASVMGQPSTDIYLASLTLRPTSATIAGIQNITDRDGYDNQPHFTPDGQSLLFTSIHDDGQADTYRYDLEDHTITRVTHTAESEYSPTVMPNGRHFSAVQVEADSTQRLWHFDLEGRNLGVLLTDVKPIGYHAWAGPNAVALYVLGPPSTLQLADLGSGRSEIIEENIGRSLHPIPGRSAVSFMHMLSDDEWWIRELDVTTKEIRKLVRTVPGNEHYTLTPTGAILMGSGSKLYLWTPASDEGWIEIADLKGAGLQGITRIAVNRSGDRIAIVGNRASGGS